MSSSNYDPKLSQAGFMDLVVALQSQLKTADSLLLLSRMPSAQREAALQLGVAANNYGYPDFDVGLTIQNRPGTRI